MAHVVGLRGLLEETLESMAASPWSPPQVEPMRQTREQGLADQEVIVSQSKRAKAGSVSSDHRGGA